MTERQFIAFDIEIARVFPEGVSDWKAFRPFGITCAATLTSGGESTIWHGRTPQNEIADQMTPQETVELVKYLEQAAASGLTILTWNGLGFDFDVLSEESKQVKSCRALALDHVDMMFHIFCIKGFPLALDKAAKGMGLAGKTPGMTGEMAPRHWEEGRRQEVLDYVAQDVRTTLDLCRAVEENRELQWSSKRGKRQYLPFSKGWLTVREAQELPEPDTSWMKTPWDRSKFTGWLQDTAAE